MPRNIAVIGGGFAGLAAASSLAQLGHKVTLFEKNESTGGRACSFQAKGFTFDMGPSWYWMPGVFEKYFNRFGSSVAEHYELKRLDPSYRVFFEGDIQMDIPAALAELKKLFEQLEPGSSLPLDRFLEEARKKYVHGMEEFAWKPSISFSEFLDSKLLIQGLRLQLFTDMSAHLRRFFTNDKILRLLEFPVLFLGARPEKTPALYSMMNYADIMLGTWYPMGGMIRIAKAMTAVALKLGVEIKTNSAVDHITVNKGFATAVTLNNHDVFIADAIVAAADYRHVECTLLDTEYRDHSEAYWESRVLSPSCLLFYVGINKRVDGLEHHNLFFESDFDRHADDIYENAQWPRDPLFYVCCPSKTDPSVAPAGCENLFILIPVAPGLTSDESSRLKYFDRCMERIEKRTGTTLRENISYYRSYAHEEFEADYNSFKGNAYGLANTLAQTAFLKPRMRSKKVRNLFYAGQMTTPGPGVPPSIISGQVAAGEVGRYISTLKNQTTSIHA